MKNIKDPIYGYLEIENEYFKLIDTASFQRLRNIRQTTYQALFPSSLHNRFVHSLGVFHLGKKAIAYFYANSKELFPSTLTEAKWDNMRKTFIVACLLHDVGHSPFSHTGEEYYKNGADLRKMLCDAIDSEAFSEATLAGTGKPHEAMSALIGLDMCKDLGFEIDRELFVRSIIGLEYSNNNALSIIKNAVVALLNGKLIDVDKLDYLTRDSFATGYSTLTIDVDRLLSGYTVCKDNAGQLCIAYKRKSHSVIENVIYANDLERRWIQNHPVILYDSMLSDFAIRYFNKDMREKYGVKNPQLQTVFIKEALTNKGLVGDGTPLRLLSDDDIIHYIKNLAEPTPIAEQFFSRHMRLKSLWKTEAVFDNYCDAVLGQEVSNGLQKDLRSVLDFLQEHTSFFINEKALSAANKAFNAAQAETAPLNNSAGSYKRVVYICEMFKKFKISHNLPDFEFAIVVASKFETNYRKVKFEKINIELAPNRVVPLENLLSVTARDASLDKPTVLFYIYTTAENICIGETNSVNLGEAFFKFVRKNYDKD